MCILWPPTSTILPGAGLRAQKESMAIALYEVAPTTIRLARTTTDSTTRSISLRLIEIVRAKGERIRRMLSQTTKIPIATIAIGKSTKLKIIAYPTYVAFYERAVNQLHYRAATEVVMVVRLVAKSRHVSRFPEPGWTDSLAFPMRVPVPNGFQQRRQPYIHAVRKAPAK